METIGTWWMWSGFFVIVLVMLAIDLFAVGGGKKHRVSLREAALWSAIWVGVSLVTAITLSPISFARLAFATVPGVFPEPDTPR